MRPGIAIRPALTDDAAGVAALGIQVRLQTYAPDGVWPALAEEVLRSFSLPAVRAAIAAPDSLVLVAERDARLLGFAQLQFGASEALPAGRAGEGPAAELCRLYVQEPATGQGLGRALLREAERVAACRGMVHLWLSAWVGNPRALAFYPRCGYEAVGSTWFELPGESHENRLFARRLASPAAGAAIPSTATHP